MALCYTKNYIRLLRVKQWIKNCFVFLPMFFAGRFFDPECWKESLIVFVSFSLLASSIYCLNDIRDVDADRKHPRKCNRPIAAGLVTVRSAGMFMAALIMASFALLLMLPAQRCLSVFGVEVAYLVLNIAYCMGLKNKPILDVFIVSVGFVLRIVAGGLACGVWLSPWIVCMTFLLALFLAFAKRRDDVAILESKGVAVRRSIVGYDMSFLNLTLSIIASVTIVCYLLYTLSNDTMDRIGSEYVYITFIFVLAGILRYLMLTVVNRESGSPTAILYSDRFLQVCIIGWVLSFLVLIYL